MQKRIDIVGCVLYNENVKIYNFIQKGACIIVLYDENFLSGEQQKIEDCYTEIGRQYYAAHKNDAEPEFADLFDSVKKCEKAMADHKAEVLLANGLMLCPRCGEQIYYKSIFCNFCGIRVVEEKPVEPVKEEPAAEEPVKEEPVSEEPVIEEPAHEESVPEEPAVNGFTDTEIDREEDFEDLHFEKAPVSEPEPDEVQLPVNEPDIIPDFEPSPAVGKIICNHCGAEIDDDCLFCVECGNLIERDKKPAEKAEKEPQQNNVRFCVECGYRVTDPEAIFCNSCGTRLEGGSSAAKPSHKKRCPRCGFTTSDPEVLFCIECGHKL